MLCFKYITSRAVGGDRSIFELYLMIHPLNGASSLFFLEKDNKKRHYLKKLMLSVYLEVVWMIKKFLAVAGLCAGLIMQPVYGEDALDPETLFKEAMQYREGGELFKSIEIFETILSNQPGLNRARLELAVSYRLTRRFEDAKNQLNKVLEDPETPDSVKLSIAAYLAQLASDVKAVSDRSKSSMYFSTGLFSDSNINLGPGKDVTGTDDPSNTENTSSGGQFMFTFSNRSRSSDALHIAQRIVDIEWLSQVTAYSKAYGTGDSDFNLSVLTINTGPALIVDKLWRAAFNFKLDKLNFGNQSYARYVGINPLFTYSIMPDLEVTFENVTSAREYDQVKDQGLKGTLTSWIFDVAKLYAEQGMGVQAGIKYHDNGAKAGYLHYTGAEVYLGGQMPAWKNARAYLTLSARDYKYKAADTFAGFSEKRNETEILAVIGVSHDIRSSLLKSWTLNSQITLSKNDSNIPNFTYDRQIIEVNMRRYFF